MSLNDIVIVLTVLQVAVIIGSITSLSFLFLQYGNLENQVNAKNNDKDIIVLINSLNDTLKKTTNELQQQLLNLDNKTEFYNATFRKSEIHVIDMVDNLLNLVDDLSDTNTQKIAELRKRWNGNI